MLGTTIRKLVFYTGLLAISSCVETYEAPKTLEDVEVLVIEGFLNGTSKEVVVNISHAQSLGSNESPEMETHAVVSIHLDDGTQIALAQSSDGVYTRTNLDIDPKRKYQLRVFTPTASYESDFVDLQQAPPIGTVEIEPREDRTALEVLVSSEDPTGSTRYYRWDFIETWEYTALFRSDFQLVNRSPVPRPAGEGVYRCYRSQSSTRILVGTSVHLSGDVINDQLIATIPVGDQRTAARYSIEVEQRGISKDEFEYLKQLQQSTEGMGGLFDPLPSQLYGNVKNIDNNSVPVLGYFSAGSTHKMRTFFTRSDLPESMKVLPGMGTCKQDTICVAIPNPYGLKCNTELKTMTGKEVITGTLFKEFETIGFLWSTPECADCRTQGGVTKMPDFW
jgi:hypothetical protein